jgi:hypothetical protein
LSEDYLAVVLKTQLEMTIRQLPELAMVSCVGKASNPERTEPISRIDVTRKFELNKIRWVRRRSSAADLEMKCPSVFSTAPYAMAATIAAGVIRMTRRGLPERRFARGCRLRRDRLSKFPQSRFVGPYAYSTDGFLDTLPFPTI